MRTALFWPLTQGVVAISYQSFGTTYRSLDSWPLKNRPIGCPETSVRNYHYSLRNSPEERSSQEFWKYFQEEGITRSTEWLQFACCWVSPPVVLPGILFTHGPTPASFTAASFTGLTLHPPTWQLVWRIPLPTKSIHANQKTSTRQCNSQATSWRLLNAKNCVQFQYSIRGICGGQCASRTGFSPVLRLSQSIIIPTMLHNHSPNIRDKDMGATQVAIPVSQLYTLRPWHCPLATFQTQRSGTGACSFVTRGFRTCSESTPKIKLFNYITINKIITTKVKPCNDT